MMQDYLGITQARLDTENMINLRYSGGFALQYAALYPSSLLLVFHCYYMYR